MDLNVLREHIKTRLAQADAENGGQATRDQQADYLLSWVGATNTPDRVTREAANPRFGQPGEHPRITEEAATVSDLIAFLVGLMATEGDLPLVFRSVDPHYDVLTSESAVWRQTDEHVNPDHRAAQFDWACLVWDIGPTRGRVSGLPGDVPALILETEG